MKHYELTYIISPETTEEEVKNLGEKINRFILEENGKIEKISAPLRKKLGYPVNKKESGFLTTLRFSLAPEKLATLKKKLKKEAKIIRHLILIKKIKKEIPERKNLPITKSPFPTLEKNGEKRIKPKKVELKDIDKKIEEILKNNESQ
ncbi:MAG: 30S ribosomal protein S6 [Candidatus Nealsonbacteria bacterium]|nr:30S ribosomal protein S6 [Candidatus Nealsonbacteria bacterium]